MSVDDELEVVGDDAFVGVFGVGVALPDGRAVAGVEEDAFAGGLGLVGVHPVDGAKDVRGGGLAVEESDDVGGGEACGDEVVVHVVSVIGGIEKVVLGSLVV